jgi:hypothetical protein
MLIVSESYSIKTEAVSNQLTGEGGGECAWGDSEIVYV